MKKGICLGSLPGGERSLEERLKLAKDAGFDGVEPGTLASVEQRERLKAAAEATGIEIPSIMNQAHWGSPLSDADPIVREKSLQGMRDSLDTAVALGADTVLLVPAVVNEKTSYEDAWARSVQEIKKLLSLAAERDVVIAVENVWNKFLLSPIEFAKYVDDFDSRYLAAYFDVGNIVLYGYPEQWIRSLGHRICKVHVKGFHAGQRAFVGLLEGTIDWAAVMRSLMDVGYNGYVTAELGVNSSDPEGGVRKISEDMDHIFAQH